IKREGSPSVSPTPARRHKLLSSLGVDGRSDHGSESEPIVVRDSDNDRDLDQESPLRRRASNIQLSVQAGAESAGGTRSTTASGPHRAPKGPNGWPLMYVLDMANGFEVMDSFPRTTPQSIAFGTAFPGHRLVGSTFRENRHRWNALSDETRDALVVAGRSVEGLWSIVPALRRMAKALQGNHEDVFM
ncbi:hypothetical protein FRC04_007935, partial [Tulasnella sp. 424]